MTAVFAALLRFDENRLLRGPRGATSIASLPPCAANVDLLAFAER